MLESVRRIWIWLQRNLKWVAVAIGAVVTFGLFKRRRRESVAPLSADDSRHLADALRPAMERRVETALKEAEEHRVFAEERIELAKKQRERVANMTPAEVLEESNAYAKRVRDARKRGTSGPLFVFVGFALFLAARGALAQATDLSQPFIYEHPTSGESGWWIPDDVWRAALADAQALAEMHDAARRLRASMDLRNRAIEELQRGLDFERGLADVSWEKLELANARLKRADSWWRSPRFLLPVGVVLGAAAIIVPAVALR